MDPNAVNQMIQQALLQQANQMQQQMQQQLQQAVAAAVAGVAAAAPAPAPAPAATAAGRPRLPPPALFEGTSAKLDEFIADIEQQVQWYNLAAAEVNRFAAGFMRGAARDWLNTLALQPADWAALVAALRARFQPVNSAENARTKLLALMQGKQSVNDYIDAFRRLLVRVPTMSDDDRFHQFRRGLRPAIALQIDMQGITTLDAAITRAAQIGGRLEGAAAVAASSNSHQPMELDALLGTEGLEPDTSAGAASSPAVTRADLELLINAMRDNRRSGAGSGNNGSGGNRGRSAGGLPRISHLSPEKVKEYMAAGKCFGCESKDHLSRQCPKRKVGADGRVSWSN